MANLLTTLEDKTWDILDRLKLGDFFEEHNIPPLVFPIAIIILIVLIAVALGSFGPSSQCGDGICQDTEDDITCYEDCAPTSSGDEGDIEEIVPGGSKVYVKINGGGGCNGYTIKLMSSSGATIETQNKNTAGLVTFEDVTEKSVYAEVSSKDSSQSAKKSNTIDTSLSSVITVTLPSDYCPEEPDKGSIEIILVDRDNGAQVTGTVSLYDSGQTKKKGGTVSGSTRYSGLDVDQFYYITVTGATGYADYNGKENMVYIEANKVKKETIKLIPITIDENGDLQVCVTSDGDEAPTSGEMTITGLDDEGVTTKFLSGFDDAGEGKICNTFILKAGSQYYAQVAKAPSGCTISEKGGPVLVTTDKIGHIDLEVDCSLTGNIRAIVVNSSNDTLTKDCTVELYYKNDTKIKTMLLGDDGNYTEYVTLAAKKDVYFFIKNVPTGYLETKSKRVEIDAGENITVKITLDVPPPPPDKLKMNAPALEQSMVRSGKSVDFSVESIDLYDPEGVLKQEGLTPTDGVNVTCAGYWGEESDAVYDTTTGWSCSLTAPVIADDEELEDDDRVVTITARRNKTEDDTVSFTILVVHATDGVLNVQIDEDYTEHFSSPAKIGFLITIDTGVGTPIKVDDLNSSNLSISPDFGSSKNVALIEQELLGSKGEFRASSLYVPFAGRYKYELSVDTIEEDTIYKSKTTGTFEVNEGTLPRIECSLTPGIVNSNTISELEIELTFRGEPLTDQKVCYTVVAGDDISPTNCLTTGNYNEDTKTYIATVQPQTYGECGHILNCSMLLDSSVNTKANYVYDDSERFFYIDTTGAKSSDCVGSCPLESTAALQWIKDCYVWAKGSLSFANSIKGSLNCAKATMDYCEEVDEGGDDEIEDPNPGIVGHTAYGAIELVATVNGEKISRSVAVMGGPGGCPVVGVNSYTLNPSDVFKDLTYTLNKYRFSGGSRSPISADKGYITGTSVDYPSSGTSSAPLSVDGYVSGQFQGDTACDMSCLSTKVDCGDTPKGSFDTNCKIDNWDYTFLKNIVKGAAIMGQNACGACWAADMDGDGVITEYDLLCVDSKTYMPQCDHDCKTQLVGEDHFYKYEICGDGKDNDCDGQTDMDMAPGDGVDGAGYNGGKTFYSSRPIGTLGASIPDIEAGDCSEEDSDMLVLEDVCSCIPETPCEMFKLGDDVNEFYKISEIKEDDVKRCVSLDGGDTYAWMSPEERCDAISETESDLKCGGHTYKYDSATGRWTDFAGDSADKDGIEPASACGTESVGSCGPGQAIVSINCTDDTCKPKNPLTDNTAYSDYEIECADLPKGVTTTGDVTNVEIVDRGTDTSDGETLYVACGAGSVLVGYDPTNKAKPWQCAKLKHYTFDYTMGGINTINEHNCTQKALYNSRVNGYIYTLIISPEWDGSTVNYMSTYCTEITNDTRPDPCLDGTSCSITKISDAEVPVALAPCHAFFDLHEGDNCYDEGMQCRIYDSDAEIYKGYECFNSGNPCATPGNCVWDEVSPQAGQVGSCPDTEDGDTCSALNTLCANSASELFKCVQGNGGICEYGFTKISTCEELQTIGSSSTYPPSGNYCLESDIDCSSITNFKPAYLNGGVFDGNGYTITSLTINRPTEGDIGLFGRIDNSEVREVVLSGVSVTGDDLVGALVGNPIASQVSDSQSSGTVRGNLAVGGLLGNLVATSTLSNSQSSATVVGDNQVGGLVGNVYGSVDNSQSSGTVTGNTNVGALIGSANGGSPVVSSSTSSGTVNGAPCDDNLDTGNLFGGLSPSSTITDCSCADGGATITTPTVTLLGVRENDLITLTCYATGGDSANTYEYEWYQKNVKVTGETSATYYLALTTSNSKDAVYCKSRVVKGADKSNWISSATITLEDVPAVEDKTFSIDLSCPDGQAIEYVDCKGDCSNVPYGIICKDLPVGLTLGGSLEITVKRDDESAHKEPDYVMTGYARSVEDGCPTITLRKVNKPSGCDVASEYSTSRTTKSNQLVGESGKYLRGYSTEGSCGGSNDQAYTVSLSTSGTCDEGEGNGGEPPAEEQLTPTEFKYVNNACSDLSCEADEYYWMLTNYWGASNGVCWGGEYYYTGNTYDTYSYTTPEGPTFARESNQQIGCPTGGNFVERFYRVKVV